MFSLTAHKYTSSHGTQTMCANDVSSGAPIRSKLYIVHTLWSITCRGSDIPVVAICPKNLNQSSKCKWKRHCLCVGKKKVQCPKPNFLWFLWFISTKQAIINKGIMYASPALVNKKKRKEKKNTGPSRCIVVLHLSFYLYNIGCTLCYPASQTNQKQTK